MFESPVRTKTKLTRPSNDVSFTLARGRQKTGLAQPYWLKIANFPHLLSFRGTVLYFDRLYSDKW